jgi:hypothetical protein
MLRFSKTPPRFTGRTVKPYRALVNLRPQLLIVIIANFLSHYPSFMAGIYSSAHTRTFCYSPQIRARSIRCAPEFSS